jgi:pSer/pThr/pTyr-binding forkhead associated (FHA) protein
LIIRFGRLSAEYGIGEKALSLGRTDPKVGVPPDVPIDWDDAVSRKHAQVIRSDMQTFVEDLGSTNGTRLNGVVLQPHVPTLLFNGDVITIGTQTEIDYVE